MTIGRSAGTLHVARHKPNNAWRTAPKENYEHRREARRSNGKLVHDGSHAAMARNDGNTVTLTLAAGPTYTVEAAHNSGDFTVSIAPQ